MKRFLFIICCWMLALTFVNAQSLEQKKICALKWTLQQTFYNKPEGQQIARLNVCDFKSLSDFQMEAKQFQILFHQLRLNHLYHLDQL